MCVRDNFVNAKHMTLNFYDSRKDEDNVNICSIYSLNFFSFELNFGNPWRDLFLRYYCLDIKLLVVPLPRCILQTVLSSNVSIVLE